VTHSNFVPEANEWEFVEINMTTYDGEPNVLVKFEAMSDRESYLYVDDINIGEASTGVFDGDITSTIEVFPNPTTGVVNVVTRLDDTSVLISDLTGKTVMSRTISRSGRTTFDLSGLPNGLHSVRFSHEEGISTQKLIVSY
jgi:hypothetical protein